MVWKCPPLHLPNWNNLWKWKTEMVKSPCTGKCELDFFDICRKCQRTKDEISRWYVMTDDEKLEVLERLFNDTGNA
jgi:predicted Fe-S protein YdhL (DUF1289 family)